jgi:uncharacterized cupredoxin-like copper-binding protein
VSISIEVRALSIFLAGVAFVTLGTACGSGRSARSDAAAVRVAERDFRIDVRPRRVQAGHVELVVRNAGPVDHELILVRMPNGTLPLRRDGLTVDEDALQAQQVAVVEPADPGTITRLQLHLRRGRYELFCNMAGHYLGGMHAFLEVG